MPGAKPAGPLGAGVLMGVGQPFHARPEHTLCRGLQSPEG